MGNAFVAENFASSLESVDDPSLDAVSKSFVASPERGCISGGSGKDYRLENRLLRHKDG